MLLFLASSKFHLFMAPGPTSPRCARAENQESGEEHCFNVDHSEVYYLIADFLKHASPCTESAQFLCDELVRNVQKIYKM